ncbi:hypothetical protein BGZ80_006526 [Entomortierella chlamydospora]|uniref:Uncharacterized protein n=1 Tax=Entomortierella chlamydospora TaxID=101097 RepID=A0A9P6MH10_9FUNG|nr:hypothetical protein BGZ79_004755 [Entomortierella chlamydospora]KAF9999676.1 hypothetical protein BGZ80_006526 [Entomortierella chlamydospora]
MTASEPIQIIRFSPHFSPPINGIRNANSNRNNYSTMSNNAPAVTYKIRACFQDPVTKQYFFLWSHVQAVIKDAVFAVDADDGTLVPFMVNETYEEYVIFLSQCILLILHHDKLN